LRAPTSTTAADAQSQNNLVQAALDSHLSWLQAKLYNLYTAYPDYNPFSNKAWNSATSNASHYDSIEAIHDQIHTDVGEGGHMNYTPTSAFDPVFFLHHCFVDKIFAWWQILYPTSWISPAPATSTTYTIAIGDTLTSQTPLTPFYKDEYGNFWTSDASWDTHSYGYAYAENTGGGSSKRSQRRKREQLMVTINKLYGPSSPLGMVRQHRSRGIAERRLAAAKANFNENEELDLSRDSTLSRLPIPSIVKNNHYTEWIANIRVKMQTLGGPFSIFIFLGAVHGDARSWATAKNLVGSMGVFTAPGMTSDERQVSGTVPLTTALMKMMALNVIQGLESTRDIQSLLTKSLKVKVATAEGLEVDVERVEGLSVKIASALVKAPASETEFPKWGHVINRFDLV
jgi:tyrosinase